MSKSNAYETGLLALLFNNTPFTLVGDAAGILGSAAPGSLYVSLHTADPGEAGTQATNETTYSGYARVAVPRTVGGWTVAGNAVTPVNPIAFPVGTAGASETATHFGIGTSAAGAGKLLYSGAITPNLPVGPSITPTLSNTTNVTED